MSCAHDHQYFPATNENGWRCLHCQDKPGEPPGFSPQLDRAKLEFAGKDARHRCHCGKLATVSSGTERWCSEHWSTL